jgi:hypothetical protein
MAATAVKCGGQSLGSKPPKRGAWHPRLERVLYMHVSRRPALMEERPGLFQSRARYTPQPANPGLTGGLPIVRAQAFGGGLRAIGR